MSEKDGFYFKEKNIKGRCEMTIKVSYIDSAGILNKAVLKIISCGESDDSGCLWLTADNNPNFACLYTNWRSYSPMSDLYSDVLSYIEDNITDDGYAEITDVDYSYGEFEFTRKIMSGKFDSSYRNLITGCSIDETFEYLVDTSDKYYTDIYVLQKSTDNVRLVARLAENGDYYKEYCADNIDSASKYFIDKMEKKYL